MIAHINTRTILRFQAAHQNQNQFNLPIFILGISHTKGRSVWMPMILLFSSNCIHEYQWILYEQYEGLPLRKKERKNIHIKPARNRWNMLLFCPFYFSILIFFSLFVVFRRCNNAIWQKYSDFYSKPKTLRLMGFAVRRAACGGRMPKGDSAGTSGISRAAYQKKKPKMSPIIEFSHIYLWNLINDPMLLCTMIELPKLYRRSVIVWGEREAVGCAIEVAIEGDYFN